MRNTTNVAMNIKIKTVLHFFLPYMLGIKGIQDDFIKSVMATLLHAFKNFTDTDN